MSVTVEPATAEVAPYASRSFAASVGGTFDGRVSWSVVRGPGTVDENGVYTAPTRVPRDRDNDIVVRATSVVDPTRFAEASVRIVDWPFTPTRGPTEGGTVLTITGSGFTGGTQVLFDGVPGTDLVVESSVLLRVTTPPRTQIGPAEVRIETPGAEPLRFPNGFQYAATRLKLGGGSLLKGCRYSRDRIAFDANRDGRLDVITSCYYDAKVAVFLNDGAGGLLPPSFVATAGTYPRYLAKGDYDADGDDDLYVSTNYSIDVFRHEPDGSFALATSHTLGAGAYAPRLVVAQLNADGRADIAYTSSNRVYVARNDGAGGYPAPTIMNAPAAFSFLSDIAAGPVTIDVDADVDLVVAFEEDANDADLRGGVLVYANGGAGTFAAPQSFLFKQYTHAVELADLNADGRLDVIAGSDAYDGSDLGVRLGIDGGYAAATFYATTYTDPVTGSTYTASLPYGYLDVSDVDADGMLDVVSSWSSFARVWYGAAGGTLTTPMRYDVTQYVYATPFAVDLDGQGPRELVSIGYELLELQVPQPNRGYGAPRIAIGSNPEYLDLRWTSTATTPDVVVTINQGAATGAALQVLHAADLSSQATVQGTYSLPANTAASRVSAVDLDKDGIGDAIVTDSGVYNGNQGSVWILPGVDAGGFGVAIQEPFDQQVTDARTSDLDGDGRLDLIVATSLPAPTNIGDLRVRWGEEGAPFSFGDDALVPSGGKPYRVTLADLDEDGRQEIIASDNVASRIAIVSVSTDRVFSDPVYVAVGDQPSEVIVDDVNLDYIPDLIVLSRYGTTGLLEIDVVKGLGDLQFDLPERYRFSGYAYSMVYEDVDGDAMKDIAITTTNPAAVAVLRGHDGGRFREPEFAPIGGTPYGLQIVDFDGNGLKDAIVTDRYGAAIRPLANVSQ